MIIFNLNDSMRYSYLWFCRQVHYDCLSRVTKWYCIALL